MSLERLHIGKFFPPDQEGIEFFMPELVLAQQAQGLQIRVIVHGTPRIGNPDWLVRVPVELHLAYFSIDPGFRRALIHLIAQWRPEVLHKHMPNVAVFWGLTSNQARRLPWVIHWQSDVVVSPSCPRVLRLAYLIYRPLEQAVAEQIERIVATSETYLHASEPLKAWRYKSSAIPLGIRTAVPDVSGLDLELPWQGKDLRLLSVGRLAHYKGFETLVQAVAMTPGVQLVIAGNGEAMGTLRRLVQAVTPQGEFPRVHLLGEVSEARKHQLLNACEVFCLASRERIEAFGVVLLEAMAHAKPCVVVDLPGSGMSWVVQMADAGLSHLPVDDPQSWHEVLKDLLARRSELVEWGLRGRRGLEAGFSIETCAHAIAGQYAGESLAQHVRQAYQLAMSEPIGSVPRDKVLVVIPARDESATIAGLVSAVRRAGWGDVLLDDQSRDDTGGLARQAGARVVRPVLPLGAWVGMQLGLRFALAHDYHAVVTMDADEQHEVQELPSLLAAAERADVVIGAHPRRASVLRKIAWRWFRTISGIDIEDLTSGFRFYNREAIRLLSSSEATLLDYQDVGELVLFERAGLKFREVPLMMHYLFNGRSRICHSWFSVLHYLAAMSALCFSHWSIGRPVRGFVNE